MVWKRVTCLVPNLRFRAIELELQVKYGSESLEIDKLDERLLLEDTGRLRSFFYFFLRSLDEARELDFFFFFRLLAGIAGSVTHLHELHHLSHVNCRPLISEKLRAELHATEHRCPAAIAASWTPVC